VAAITLSEEEVLRIHYVLVEEFSKSNNPIDPPGVKSQTLLGSAVSRQHCSLGGLLKYPDAIHNAATLAFGLCCDHPFHNGNKRTALVAFLVHLDKNRLSLAGVPDAHLFNLMLSIAQHDVVKTKPKEKDENKRPHADDEVEAIAQWIRHRAKNIKRGEKQITYRQLRRILARFDFELGDPDGNSIKLYRLIQEKPLFRPARTVRHHIATIGYPREGVVLSIATVKFIRRVCKLREEDGIDSDAFYEEGAVIDAFINQHRNILERLANR
jgi:prophage maintenance system killer protein